MTLSKGLGESVCPRVRFRYLVPPNESLRGWAFKVCVHARIQIRYQLGGGEKV